MADFVQQVMLISPDALLHGWSACGVCGSTNLDGDSIDMDDTVVTQKVYCTDCLTSWVDIYEAKYREVKTGVELRL